MKSTDAIAACAALASAPRLALYRLLVRRGPEGFTPSELTRRLRMPAPTLSFHLKALLLAGLVSSRRAGRHLYYSPDFARVNALVAFLTDHCCSLAEGRVHGCAPACGPQRKRT